MAAAALAAYEYVPGGWNQRAAPTPFLERAFDDFQTNPRGDLARPQSVNCVPPVWSCNETTFTVGAGLREPVMIAAAPTLRFDNWSAEWP